MPEPSSSSLSSQSDEELEDGQNNEWSKWSKWTRYAAWADATFFFKCFSFCSAMPGRSDRTHRSRGTVPNKLVWAPKQEMPQETGADSSMLEETEVA